ncbi:hypothetical protein TCELL_0256 [Thermogladius calderae 1633]|uniref:Uncharacterized protein n=1 Tax=Thermogladius calderae (strain DSM 22663 / VKM B-2946 / 1633) TaxID=1184251 RepID=I3TD43_THEC1|nr:hypothetical protein TCELL_0256 [Thermogladius calderae 1633]
MAVRSERPRSHLEPGSGLSALTLLLEERDTAARSLTDVVGEGLRGLSSYLVEVKCRRVKPPLSVRD